MSSLADPIIRVLFERYAFDSSASALVSSLFLFCKYWILILGSLNYNFTLLSNTLDEWFINKSTFVLMRAETTSNGR